MKNVFISFGEALKLPCGRGCPIPPKAALAWCTGGRLVSYSVRFVSYLCYLWSALTVVPERFFMTPGH